MHSRCSNKQLGAQNVATMRSMINLVSLPAYVALTYHHDF